MLLVIVWLLYHIVRSDKPLATSNILPDENVVEALAIDHLGRNLYVMDGMRQLLLACRLKDLICTIVLTNTTSSPRSLKLDLTNKWDRMLVKCCMLVVDKTHLVYYDGLYCTTKLFIFLCLGYDGDSQRVWIYSSVQHLWWQSWL